MSGEIRVLHVDDDTAFADVTREFLESETDRITVETAGSPADGLAALEDDGIDCVVSDYDMPDRNGIEFLEAVREIDPELPFLLFTGKGSEEIASEAISAGVTDYLQKETGSDQYTVLANRIETAVEKHRTERELDATRRRYKKLVEQNFIGIYIIQDGEFVYVNPKLAAIHGYDREELVGTSPLELVAPEERDRVRSKLSQRLDGEVQTIQYQTVGLTSEGEHIDIGLHGSRIVYDGAPAVIGAELDISDRKEKERQLTRLKQRFQAYVENTSDIITVLDEDGTIQYQSPSIERVLGYDPATMGGVDVSEYVHPDDRDRILDRFSTFVQQAEDTTERVEYRFRHADGEWRWLESIASNHRGEEFDGIVINSRDVTERRRHEQQLTRFRKAVENAGYAVFITDTDGTIEYVNPAFEAMTGYDAEEAYGETPRILSSGEMSEEYFRKFWETILAGEVWSKAIVNERKSGERYHADQTIAPITDDGEVTAFVAIQADVTERKAYERELERQNEQLEEFATVISHDLRNPLNVATNRLELAQADTESEHHAPMATALDRMTRIIDDVLWLAREGREVGSTEPIALRQAVESSWSMVVDGNGAGDPRLGTTLGDEFVVADDDRLQQLLENLFRNAIDHGGEDVTVTVDVLEDGFAVEDDGPGIPAADRQAVFEAGFSTAEDGTGFGLRIVQRVAEAHGWDVSVTEGADGGARFEVTGVAFTSE